MRTRILIAVLTLLVCVAGPARAQEPADARATLGAFQNRLIIGITSRPLDELVASHLGLEPEAAFVVTSTTEGMPAAKAGLAVNDVVTTIEGVGPATVERLRSILSKKKPGGTLALSGIRKGKPFEVTIRLEAPFQSTAKLKDFKALEKLSYLPKDAGSDSEVARLRAELAKLQVLQGQAAARVSQAIAQLQNRNFELQDAQGFLEKMKGFEKAKNVEAARKHYEWAKSALDAARKQFDEDLFSEAQKRFSDAFVLFRGQGQKKDAVLFDQGVVTGKGITIGKTAADPSIGKRLDAIEGRLARMEALLKELVAERKQIR